MKDFLAACAKELTSSRTTHVAAASAGAIVVGLFHRATMNNGRTFVLPKEAYDALVNDETNFVRFSDTRNDHVFRISYEH